MKASPSFQFYPDRWLGGTSHLSPAARGIYLDLLCWQWNNAKPLPLSVATRTQIGRCTLEQFTSAWVEISDKFHETPDGFRNEALERGRNAGMTFMDAQREKAKKGAAARWAKHAIYMPGAEGGIAPGIPPGNAPVMPSISISISNSDLDLPISDSHSADPATSKIENTRAVVQRAREASPESLSNHSKPTNLLNGAEMRRHGTHAWCSMLAGRDGLCVPYFLHTQFMGKGAKSDDEMRAWYATTVTAMNGTAIGEDELIFWRNKFAEWVGIATTTPKTNTPKPNPEREASMAAFRQGVKERNERRKNARTGLSR